MRALDVTPSSARSTKMFQTEGRGIVDASGDGLYVVRRSDDELFERLARGEPCHVLAPRQIGKSSLRVRTQARLRARGVRCASVDLTSIGSGASADEWYFSLAATLVDELALPDGAGEAGLDALWRKNRRMSPVRRFRQFLHDTALADPSPVVVFLDEIDVTLSLPFSRDDFFGLIREMHQARAVDARWEQLTFCLIGVAAPLDLVSDPERTPFNVSHAVRLDDFTREEAQTFLPALALAGGDPEALLDAVHGWTSGHPALTQRLCYRLTRQEPEERAKSEGARADALVSRLFLSSGRIDDPILLDTERRFAGDRPDARIPVMLHLYRRLLEGERVAVDGNNPRQFGLRIAGLVAEREDDGGMWLEVRNRIFAQVFHRGWVEEKLARRFLTEPLQIWKDSGRKDDHVLRGGALGVALAWAQGREDITPDERDFLQASQAMAQREQEERQQAELERVRRERAETQLVAQRRLVSLLVVSFVLVAFSLLAAIFQYQAAQSALDQETRRREADHAATALLQQSNEERLRRAEEDARRAQLEADEAQRSKREAIDAADAAKKEADDAKKQAEEAQRGSGSKGAEYRARMLLMQAKKKSEEAALLQIKAQNAAQAADAARRKLDEARRLADRAHATSSKQGESVVASVEGALEVAKAENATLREERDRKAAEAAAAQAEVARLKGIIGQLNESIDRVSKERNAAQQGSRFATPPTQPSAAPTSGGKDDIYD